MDAKGDLWSFLAGGRDVGQRPWPRYVLSRADWQRMVLHLTASEWDLLALWGERAAVHAALYEPETNALAVASLECPDRRFPSLSGVRPAAIRFERATQDLCGLIAEGLDDRRPWLDHGQWGTAHPLGARKPAVPRPATQYEFLAAEGKTLHQIPVGPVHAGIIEPGHFRFHANGETVVRLEERLGYVHKGHEALMAGKRPAEAARIAARLSGDSTVAASLAFACAVEAATGTEPPPRAVWLRALMAELERIANHCGDIGAISNDASFVFFHARFGIMRETVLRAAARAFGHRLMMDCIVPGGVRGDLDPGAALKTLASDLQPQLAYLMRIYDNKPSLLDRTVGTGVVSSELVMRFAAGGHVGRASGRYFDARKHPGYAPYDRLDFTVPVLAEGDVHSRILIRAREIEQSLGLIGQILDALPPGAVAVPLAKDGGEGIALAEGFRGEYLAWVTVTSDGAVGRCHLRDPSWLQWPLLEAAIEGNIVADFPLCNKSFNCSYSGHDL